MATLFIVLVRDWKAKVEARETTKTEDLCKRQYAETFGRCRIAGCGEMVQQMVTTIFNAERRRIEHQEELSKLWKVATRSKTVGRDYSRRQNFGNQLGGVAVRIW